MPERQVERISKYNLSGAVEDTYASKTAQNPTTSRRAKSLIPTPAGYLEREPANAKFSGTKLPSGVVWLFEFDQNVGGGIVRYFFAATAATLYQLTGSPGSGTWSPVTAVGALNGTPVAQSLNNLMHFSDGVNSFIFDGTNWVTDGLPIPQRAPSITVENNAGITVNIVSVTRTNGIATIVLATTLASSQINSRITIVGNSLAGVDGTYTLNTFTDQQHFTISQPGLIDGAGTGGTCSLTVFSVLTNRYYWTTFADQSGTHPHESSSSPKSLGSGPINNGVVAVLQRPGIASVTANTTALVGSGTDFNQTDVGLYLWIGVTGQGPDPKAFQIVAVADSHHATLATAPTAHVVAQNFVIAPLRTTHIGVYCSETENSNVGFLLGYISLFGPTSPTQTGFNFLDQSPFSNVPNSYINITLQRPIRNDPTTGTKIMAVHKRRIFRRNEKLPNFFNYTAFEEVKATGVGTAEECVPGHDPNTISDLVNEQSYPEQSRNITAMVDHADALFIGTEKSVIPLFGETIDDFVLSQITAFSVGMAGPYSTKSTPHGLLFLSYDRKFYLWPQQWIPFYAPEETTTLIELSRPKRLTLQNINPGTQNQVWTEFFNFGKRNWAVLSFQDLALVWHTYVFDFEVKGWFELQRGVQSIAIFEPSQGVRVLVGGGTDGFVYVLDDPTGFFSTAGAPLPAGIYRPALIDFGEPDSKHICRYVEFELSNSAMASDITVNFYLDPIDVDNPGAPTPITMTQVRGANRWRGFFTEGALCERVLMEFLVASSTNIGNILSITLAATPASKLIA